MDKKAKKLLLIILILTIFLASLFFGFKNKLSNFLSSVFLTIQERTIGIEILYSGSYQSSANPGDLLATPVSIKNIASETIKLNQVVLGNRDNNNFLSYIEADSYNIQYTDSKKVVRSSSLVDSGTEASNGYRIFNISPAIVLPGYTREYQVSARLKDNIPLEYLTIKLTDIYASGVKTGASIKSKGSLSVKINILKPSIEKTCSDSTPYGQCSKTKPKYCQEGVLINHCKKCGCPSGQVCQTDNTCQEPAPEPETEGYLHLKGTKTQYNIGEQVKLK